jgi:hypothetical protein
MRQRLRENVLCALVAAGGCGAIGWLGLYGFGWGDYDIEARPALEALTHGHVLDFLRLAPAYGGSLVERAPFALAPGLWGGGSLAVYRMVALPCLIAVWALGVWLVSRMRAQGRAPLACAVVLGVCVANPLTLRALELGHPEELLGGCMCVAATLLAVRSASGRDRSLLAGVLLGLAIANKDWALVAVGPVLLALPPERRKRCLLAAGATAGLVIAPLVLVGSGGFVANTATAAAPAASAIFKPWQLWWFFGHHSPLALGPSGTPQPGYRVGPGWVGEISHPLVLASALALVLALWRRNGRAALSEQRALLALALALLLRCLLDTWDESYYLLPFVLAVLAWELSLGPRHPPVLAAAASATAWISFQWLPERASADVQAAVFLAWSLPLAVWLGLRLFSGRRPALARSRAAGDSGVAQETTVSALGRLVKTS